AGIRFGIRPDAALGVRILCSVRAQDGTEGAELNPARVKLGSDGSGHMAANVVAPVGVADISSGRGEPRLKRQRWPNGDSVSGEADLIAVIAQPAPAVEEQRAFALALLIGKVEIVQPPGVVHAWHFGV